MVWKRWYVGVAAVSAMVASGCFAQNNWPKIPITGAKSVREITPTTADPGLKTDQNEANVVVMPAGTPRPELMVWLPGSNGHPKGDESIIATGAKGGYRVIGLQYNNQFTVENKCGPQHDPECLTKMRAVRFDGSAQDAVVPNTVAEGVEHRLTMLLKYLAAKYPDEGWGQYLDGDMPAWKKIVLAGHSQGAGMTAYIAKKREVARAVLFSGGADGEGLSLETRKWSSWLTAPSKTPMDRWYAEYNAKEAIALAEPYNYVDILKIPKDHVLVFSLDLPTGAKQGPGLMAHMSVVHDPRYLPQWQWMLGISDKKP